MKYTEKNFRPEPGQKYKVGSKLVILIPQSYPDDSYIGEVIEGKGWEKEGNPQHIGDYKPVATNTYWAFSPCFTNLIQEEEEVVYDIY